MYLSKLEIIGFKSFAQKVNLLFDSGISAIVGPNGCGKTNIVDAIRWVLGEQRYSALRSERMEDVIFSGTKSRKPLGMAEVSLIIENTKGILPSEYSQVTIGRRVYRSGESEYLLNKVPCRLKDIVDLFMDTGMGADAYSVIELKMVETILSDRTDERRRLFEEAAGVTKYKHRRKAAYRKLESVQADLIRVNDIVSEVQKAVNSLERQARKAEQHNEVKQRLKTLEIDLMEREYAQLVGRIRPLEERLSSLTAATSRIDVDLSREEGELDRLRGTMADIDDRMAEVQRDLSNQMDKIHMVEQKNVIAAERMNALQKNIDRYEAEKEELQQEMRELEELKTSLQKQIIELQTEAESTDRELALNQTELDSFEKKFDAKKNELQSFNEQTIGLVHEIADRQTELDRKKGFVENLGGRSAHAHGEIQAYEEELIRISDQIAALSAEDKQLRRRFTEAEMKYYDAEKQKRELQERIEAFQQTEIELRGQMERKKARMDFLKSLIESREGMPESVRFLSSTNRWDSARDMGRVRKLGQRKLTVADIVQADEKYRTAIESALGANMELIVVSSSESAAAAIALLKEAQKGKATFVCLDRLPEIGGQYGLPKLRGVHGWATDLARFDAEYTRLFRYILDSTLIVEDVSTARQVAGRFPGIRCVTLDGEIETGVGLKKGGSTRQDEGGTIGRHEQITELERNIAGLEHQLVALSETKARVAQEFDALQLKPFTDAVKGVEKEMHAVEMRIAQLEFEKKRAGDIIAKNKEEIGQLTTEAGQLQSVIETATPEFEAVRQKKSEVERTIGAVSNELETLELEWNKRSRMVNELGIKVVSLRGARQNAENEFKRAGEAITDILGTLAKRDSEIQAARDAIAVATANRGENAGELAGLRKELEGIERRKTTLEEESAEIRDEIHRIELKIKDERRSHDDSLKATHDIELKIADLKAKCEHINARAYEEFEVRIELKAYPEDEFVDFAKLREEIQQLRDKIKALGNINFAAFEEYTSEKERFEFLTTQRSDLMDAEKTLLATIEEINTTAQNKFLETFEKIRTNFIETFKSLFDPGDECDLKLEEGVDPLEAKIEIVAKPRGKRPTSIDLLSGGEKTLTATALLFAIYLVKPSPFCILDEVDAPLDDANIDRFTRILHKFSGNTQFIVVTHNKRTMESASALYGVTMEEEGVSKLVTVRFNKESRVQSASVATG